MECLTMKAASLMMRDRFAKILKSSSSYCSGRPYQKQFEPGKLNSFVVRIDGDSD
jgi:hypothetical protein